MIRRIALKKEIFLGGTVLCGLAALLLFYVRSHASVEETKRISLEVHEGTELAFDLSPDGKTIAFDLLGQIWLLPFGGGEAKAITDSVRESAEHLLPAFTADGKRVVFWEARPESWGLTSMDLAGGERRILTALSSSRWDSGNDRFFACSPAKAEVVLIRDGKPMIISEAGGTNPVELNVEGAFPRGITDPVWAPGGSGLAFVAGPADYADHSGGRLWKVGADGGKAEPLSAAKTEVRAPCYSPDGLRMAYFIRSEDRSFEVWISGPEGSDPHKLASHEDITPLRLRWTPDGKDLVYCAEGRLWKIPVDGGQAREIPFTARSSFSQEPAKLRPVQFPKPRESRPARGQMGLAISPDGEKIAAIALGRLWVWEVGNKPAAVTRLPVSASGLCWSPDNTEVAWSAGVTGTEDLFATSVVSGLTRRLTAIPGTEVRASWSPDGKYVAFVYRDSFELGARPKPSYESLRAIKVADAPITDLAQTLRLQVYPAYGQSLTLSQGRYWGRPWSPDSQHLLGESQGKPALIPLEGRVLPLKDSRELPSYRPILLWEAAGSLLYTSNFLLWRAPFDTQVGMNGEPVPVSLDPALYPSAARDGSILYVSDDGLRLRRPGGDVDRLGWPLSFETAAPPQSLLIRNVRIIPGTGAATTEPRDILVDEGRISRIAARGRIRARRNTTVLEGEGRTVIPGLIDAHVHVWDQTLLSEFLYEGITTVREMGSPLAWAKGFQELVEAGIQSGPRIVLGGFLGDSQIHPWLADSPQIIGNPNGEDGAGRALSLARAFDVDFIKMYKPVNPSSGARFIRMAHERGFPVSSHAGYPLPLVASGIDCKEHTISFLELGPRICSMFRDDIVQLTKESGMAIVPTLSCMTRQLAAKDGSIVEQVKDSPFLSGLLALYGFATRAPAFEKRLGAEIMAGRENAARFHRAGVPLAAGTDSPFHWMPWALHGELEELVASGLSPLEAITTASLNAARVLKAEKEIGTVEKGKLADLVILDADPTADIRNARKIWKVVQGGKVVDRDALQNWTKREAEEVANIRGVLSVPGMAAQDPRPAAADLSGVEKFLELMAILEQDREPAPQQWDALFATPGYSVLLQREFQREFFAERFRLAFMPSRADALNEQLKKDTGFRAQFLPHYLRAKAMRREIQRWTAEQRPVELYAEAVAKARLLLPDRAVTGWPAVAFVIFAPDSRGYDPVVLDVLYCMDKGGRLVDLVGHEFHHYYRNRLVDLNQDQATLWVIDQIHAEGIADLIDKADWTSRPESALAPDEKAFVKLYRESPSVIRAMDSLLSRMNGVKMGRGELGNELRRAVPQSGHPTGLYMAILILEELGRPALVGVADDPFAFFHLYQEASAKRGGDIPRFSGQAMKFLDNLAGRR